ncbi:hypothetical protein ACFY3V_38425 [Streptosporangium sp. NPDC000095]|uniref:hypothetical protein n=1 Tax=Streptosporangium sp. NPDC000095 TaxID=3366184 RepID=UPI0036B39CF9
MTATITAAATIGIFIIVGFSAGKPPADLVDACRSFITAHDEAATRAKKQNDATLQTELAHPIRVSDVWEARNQAPLEAAALKVQNFNGVGDDQKWAGIAWQLVQAVTVMDPTSLDGAVQKESALSAAHAGCVGR